MKKLFFGLLTVIVCFTCLTACSVTEHGYYDNNEAILANPDNYSLIRASSNNTSKKSTLEASQFDGCKKIKTLTVGDNPSLDVTLKIASGRLKLIAMSGENEIFTVAEVVGEQTEIQSPVTANLAAGSYRFVLVAEVAEEVEFEFNYPII